MRCAIALILIPLTAGVVWGQRALSAKAGLIHYVSGVVNMEGKRLKGEVNESVYLDQGQLLTTGRGRVEILLNPGTFLRLDEHSSVRLLSTGLTDTQVELVSGLALIDVQDLRKDNAIRVKFEGSQIEIRKRGLYHLSAAESGRLRVYDGEVYVSGPGFGTEEHPVKVRKGRYLDFNAGMREPGKFDREDTDELYRWNAQRTRYIARANASSASAAGGGLKRTFNPQSSLYSFIHASRACQGRTALICR